MINFQQAWQEQQAAAQAAAQAKAEARAKAIADAQAAAAAAAAAQQKAAAEAAANTPEALTNSLYREQAQYASYGKAAQATGTPEQTDAGVIDRSKAGGTYADTPAARAAQEAEDAAAAKGEGGAGQRQEQYASTQRANALRRKLGLSEEAVGTTGAVSVINPATVAGVQQ